VFGSDPRGGPAALAARQDTGEAGRWRRFTREQIAQRGDSLDISWLKDSGAASTDQSRDDPSLLAGLALKELNAAVSELRSLLEELGEDPDAVLEAVVADDSAEDGEGAIA
jgi:type I restriction enzyme M protein